MYFAVLKSKVKKMLQEDAIREVKDKVKGRVFNWNMTYQEFTNVMASSQFQQNYFLPNTKNFMEYRGRTKTKQNKNLSS